MSSPRAIDWETVKRALGFALEIHGDQARKGTDVPYAAHLLGVASLVLEHGGQTKDVVIALLHDSAEDQGGLVTLARVDQLFGTDVALGVRALSDALPAAGETKPPWRERKERYVAGLAQEPIDILVVSASDKLYNLRATLEDLRAIGPTVWNRFNEPDPDAHLWYYDALITAFESRAVEHFGLAGLALELRAAWRDLSTLVVDG